MFPEDNKHCVPQLWHLGESEQPGPETTHLQVFGFHKHIFLFLHLYFHLVLLYESLITDGVVDTSCAETVQQLWEGPESEKVEKVVGAVRVVVEVEVREVGVRFIVTDFMSNKTSFREF